MKHVRAILSALLAAAFYAVNVPVSKLLLRDMGPAMMAALLYLGAGLGIGLVSLFRREDRSRARPLSRQDLPFVVGMIVLDIAAPILLMTGIRAGSSSSASLLGNFEIAATAVIALFVFHEGVSKRLWAAIGLITLSSALLSFQGADSLRFSPGSLLVLLAAACWGFENNCTRMMSQSDPLEIVVIKGFGSGLGSLLIALAIGEPLLDGTLIPMVLLLGFVAYGLSIFFYVYAQRGLGAAMTSAFYAIAPFIGVALSFLMFRDPPGLRFFIALTIMIAGAYLAAVDSI